MRCRHRPAAGQLMLLFVAALGDPAPPPVVARGRAPAPRPRIDRLGDRDAPGVKQAARGDDGAEGGSVLAAGAHCCVCRTWPAPVETWVSGRIMLTCRSCAGKPSTRARLEEIAAVEWTSIGDPCN